MLELSSNFLTLSVINIQTSDHVEKLIYEFFFIGNKVRDLYSLYLKKQKSNFELASKSGFFEKYKLDYTETLARCSLHIVSLMQYGNY